VKCINSTKFKSLQLQNVAMFCLFCLEFYIDQVFLKEIDVLYYGLPGTTIALKKIVFIRSD